MKNENNEHIAIKNYMEICVENAVDSILEETNMCHCERCRLDVMAIALNNLPSKYVATRQGILYVKLDTLERRYDVSVVAEITKAIDIVREQKRHE